MASDRRSFRLPLVRWPIFLVLYLNLLVKAAKKRDHVSLNNYGEVLPLFADVFYVHSRPLSTSANENPFAIPLWSLMKPLYRALLCIFSSHFSGLILTNSRYNEGKIEAPPRSQIIILYPPVDNNETVLIHKTPSTLTASRLSRSQNLEIIPRIAALVTARCEFNLCLSSSYDEAKIASLRGSSIIITLDPTLDRLKQLRQTSTIYLSTQPTETFGLSILEAMDVGCIPVVPRDGGPWHDILEEQQGIIGYAYRTPEEAAKQIDKILNDAPLAEKLGEAARQRARQYQGPTFSTNLLRVLTAVHARKTKMCNQLTGKRRT